MTSSPTGEQPDDPTWETHLHTTKEKVQVIELQKILGEALTTGAHSEFQEVVGSINLLRYLRGCNHDVKAASDLFLAHLNLRELHNLNQVRERCIQLLNDL